MVLGSFLQDLEAILETRLFSIAGTPINTATIITFFVIILAAIIASRVVTRSLRFYFDRSGVTDDGSVAVTMRLVHFVIVALGFTIAIHTIGINMSALFAAGALFAVGLGFAVQNIAQNFVSGVILMLERAIKPGDVLEVQNQMVRVQQMGHRAIVARTLDDEELIIPNSVLVQSTVKNYTLRDHLYRIRVAVGVIYGSDMKLVRKSLEDCVAEMPERSTHKKPVVYMTEFGDNSVNFEVSIWIDHAWKTREARSKLHERIWWALKEVGVTIAFPQLDLHLDPPVVEALQTSGKRPRRHDNH